MNDLAQAQLNYVTQSSHNSCFRFFFSLLNNKIQKVKKSYIYYLPIFLIIRFKSKKLHILFTSSQNASTQGRRIHSNLAPDQKKKKHFHDSIRNA